MGVAELICSRCGTPAPAGRSTQLLLTRAERAFDEGQLREAVSLMERALEGGVADEGQALLWRKLGIWIEKESQESRNPALLVKAGQAFAKALAIKDADEITHQLFIANFAKQGNLAAAKAYYQNRLDANPADATAIRQINVIKLSSDFLLTPPKVSLNLPPRGVIERWLKPSTWKVASAGFTLLSSLVMIVLSLMHSPSAPATGLAALADSPGMPVQIEDLIYDPWSWALQGSFSALLLYLMYRNRGE
jgi:tetratricopeptide (TPR) repeat protein